MNLSPQPLPDALEIVPGVTEADLAGTGYHLRKTNAHTYDPPDAPQNVRLKATGISGEPRWSFKRTSSMGNYGPHSYRRIGISGSRKRAENDGICMPIARVEG